MNHDDIPLGKDVGYPDQYDPSLLFPVVRQLKRDELGLNDNLPFHGSDFWNAYEMSCSSKTTLSMASHLRQKFSAVFHKKKPPMHEAWW